jgi:ATP-dependent Lon protease
MGLAATGELTLHGEVKAVGGVHEKVVAARLAGCRTVLVPRRNGADVDELPPEVRARVAVVLVDSAAEALAHALGPPAAGGGRDG